MLDYIVLLAVFFVLLYCFVASQYGRLSKHDQMIILFAVSILVIYYVSVRSCYKAVAVKSTTERFVDSNIKVEENISAIKNIATVYLTTFNDDSYNESKRGLEWVNIADPGTLQNSCCELKRNFTFSKDPLYSRKTGFNLIENPITGPLACGVGIDYPDAFSIMFTFRMKNMSNVTDSVKLIQLKANTSNNNGLSIVIPQNSIKNKINNVMTCGLEIILGMDTYKCGFKDGEGDEIPFERNTLTSLYLVKTRDTLRVVMTDEKSSSINTILDLKGIGVSANFSNSPVKINSDGNWAADLFIFAIFKEAISPNDISSLSASIRDVYVKNRDSNYQAMMKENADLSSQILELKSCPYDSTTCNPCSDVKDWKNPIEFIATSSAECKKSLNLFCSGNRKDPKCGGCYDPAHSNYNTDVCRWTRNIMSSPENFHRVTLDALSPQDIEYIKSKNKWITKGECPAPPPPPPPPPLPPPPEPSAIVVPPREITHVEKGFWAMVMESLFGPPISAPAY
jgi:hypothetical protein